MMRIELHKDFCKAFKRLHKRYRNLHKDLAELTESLYENPMLGTDLGNGIRKVRMPIRDKNKGKSGGARLITLLVLDTASDDCLCLLYIYDKSERENISDKEIADLIARM